MDCSLLWLFLNVLIHNKIFPVSTDVGGTGGKKRPADCLDDDHEDMKRKRYEDENLEETVAEIVADIEDQSKLMGPQVFEKLYLF